METQDNGSVNITYNFLVPPELVFDAWTKPDLVRKWLFVGPTSEIVDIDLDLRVQGKFSIVELEKTNNDHIDHYGTYTEIKQPNKLVFTLSVPKHFPAETAVTVEINTTTEGCELKLLQTGVQKNIT